MFARTYADTVQLKVLAELQQDTGT